MTSQKQIEANRENARKSTGPSTVEGKATSSQNAVKHGMWATRPAPITRGPYREDPDQLEAMVLKIYRSLEPRDALEAAQAMRVAQQYVRLARLNRFEVEALAFQTEGIPFGKPEAVRAKGAISALTESLSTATALDSRIGRSLERALLMYADLQRRILPEERK